MPPQTDQNQTSSQPADFGFMLNQQQPKAQTTRSGRFSSLGKPAKLLLTAIAALIVAIVAALLLSGGDNSSKLVLDLLAQNQEIIRVSQAQDQKFKDADTKGLSATTQAALSSQKFQLSDYLSRANFKYNQQQLVFRMNTETDQQLLTAAQNNNLDDAYIAYLKNSLTTYLNSLDAAFKSSKSQTLKSTLQSAYTSVQTLLKSQQFKS